MFDVFLSHNSREKPAVERIAEGLKRAAVEPWLDKWCLTPGGDWQDELAEGLRRSNSCAVFVGPEGIGDWARLEFKLATDRMAKDRNFRVFLVLLPGLPEPFDTSSLPPFLTTRTWVDMRKGVADPRAFQTLINAVKGVASGPEMPIAARDDVCPYRGLRAFDEEHSEFFFGRDADIQRLVEKLKTTRFLAVLGPSGSGKSSVVRAGLIPTLRKGALPGSEAWKVQVFTPGASPLTQLAANLVRFNPQSSATRTLDELSADERALHLACSVALAERPESERVVWVVDQFEEIFTLCRDEAERARFVSNLLYAAGVPGGRGLVVLTMRADFYQKCAAYPELSAQVAAQQFLVSPMSMEGLRQAIAKPAWRVGLEFEQGLVETVLDDVEGQPGALPLLEHTLLELWERRRGRLLTLEAYRETGGVEGAIAKRADAVFETFDNERQTIARRVMLRLTQPGEGTEDTRRRATMAELVTRPEEAEKVHEVVRALSDARLLTAGVGEEGGVEIVDVSHEALIRSWPRLRRWVEEDRQGLRTHRRVTEAAGEWQRANRDESLLFRGARLAQTAEWRERRQPALNEIERAFLDASTELQEQERRAVRRRIRFVVAGLVAALILISVAFVYASIQRRLATRRGEETYARELAANAMAQLPVNPELSLRLAIEAAQRKHLPETENTLRQVLAKAPRYVLHSGQPSSGFNAAVATYAHEGKVVALGYGKSFRTFDAESGRLLFNHQIDLPVTHVVSSPTGGLVAVALDNSEGAAQATDEVHPSPAALDADGLDNSEGTAGATYLVKIWEGERPISTLPIEDTSMEYMSDDLTFSPDGKFLVFGSGDASHVYEVASGKDITKEDIPKIDGSLPSFSRDGQLLLTRNPNLYVTDTSSWQRVATIPSYVDPDSEIAFGIMSPDGQRVLAISEDGRSLLLHDARGGRLIRKQRMEESLEQILAAFSDDGRFIAIANVGKLFMWDMDVNSAPPDELGIISSQAFRLSFSPDGRLLVVVNNSVTQVYDVKSRRVIAEFRAAIGSTVSNAEFSPDSRSLLTSNTDGTAYVWDLSASRAEKVMTDVAAPATDATVAALSRDGKLFAYVAPGEGDLTNLHIWGTDAANPPRLLKSDRYISSITFSPDGKRLLTTNGTSAQVWELDGGDDRAGPKLPHGEGIRGAIFDAEGKQIATWGGENGAKVWDADGGHPPKGLQTEAEVSSVAFSPDGHSLLFTEGAQAHVWNLNSQQAASGIGERRDDGGGLARAVYSTDAHYILTWGEVNGSMLNSVQIRDAGTGHSVMELNGHVDDIKSVKISPDGEYVLTASGYSPTESKNIPPDGINEVRVWDLMSGTSFYEFRDHGRPLLDGVFAADSKSVIVVDETGAAYVYACELCVPLEELLKIAEKRNVRPLTPDERARYLRE